MNALPRRTCRLHTALCLFALTMPVGAQVLPDKLPPIPAVPAPKPPGSVAMGNPKDFPEIKMDFPMAAGPFQPTWDSINANYHGEPEWLRDAKFGIWVHFGPQSAGGSGDWYARRLYIPGERAYKNHERDFGPPSKTGYIDVLHAWNPKALDPAKLVSLYHDAGARFLLIQGVHHDNFDNWNSRYNPWNSVNIGPHRDILGEWAKAAKSAHMHFGVAFHHEYTWWWFQTAFGADKSGPNAGIPYDAARLTLADGVGKWWEGYDPRLLYTVDLREYQGMDTMKWNLPQGIFINHQAYARWYMNQWALRILDVIEKYDPDFFYTDGNSTQPFSGDKSGTGAKSDADQRVIASFFNRALQKHGKVDVFNITKFHGPCNGIVSTAEASFPNRIKTDQPWIGENAVGDWFYAPGFTYDAGSVIRCLLEYVSRDGNYMVNIPIKPDGSIDDACTAMLKETGDWLAVNGEGIYGSSAWKVLGEGAGHRIRSLPAGQLGRRQAEFAFSTSDFRFTRGKDGSVYAFCMTVPQAGETVSIRSFGTEAGLLENAIHSVTLLGSAEKLEWKQTPETLAITCPAKMPLKFCAVFKIR
ncbi:MAG: alpha-L-fucosidase [Phycisphaerae bacterium]